MKKIHYFAIFSIIMAISACTLPKQIEITGINPRLNFSVDTSLNKMILDLFEDSFGADSDIKISLLDCTAIQDVQTYLAIMTLEKSVASIDYEIPEEIFELIDMVRLRNNIVAYDSEEEEAKGEEPIIFELGSISTYLDGLSFDHDKIEARLYLNSNYDIIKDMEIIFEFVAIGENGEEIDPGNPLIQILIPEPGNKIEPVLSDIDTSEQIYPYDKLPDSGIVVESFAQLLNAGADIKLKINAIVLAGTWIDVEIFRSPVDIIAELVIWLPLAFEITEGAEIKFPSENFEEAGEYVEALADVLDSVSLVIGMTNNPLSGGSLVIEQPGTSLKIVNPLNAQSPVFSIGTGDLDKIFKLGRDFAPDVSIRFEEAENIIFPRDLGITTIYFDAKLSYTVNL